MARDRHGSPADRLEHSRHALGGKPPIRFERVEVAAMGDLPNDIDGHESAEGLQPNTAVPHGEIGGKNPRDAAVVGEEANLGTLAAMIRIEDDDAGVLGAIGRSLSKVIEPFVEEISDAPDLTASEEIRQDAVHDGAILKRDAESIRTIKPAIENIGAAARPTGEVEGGEAETDDAVPRWAIMKGAEEATVTQNDRCRNQSSIEQCLGSVEIRENRGREPQHLGDTRFDATPFIGRKDPGNGIERPLGLLAPVGTIGETPVAGNSKGNLAPLRQSLDPVTLVGLEEFAPSRHRDAVGAQRLVTDARSGPIQIRRYVHVDETQ